MKTKALPIFLMAGLLAFCSGCSRQESEDAQTILVPEDQEETFVTVTADYGTITQTLSIPCTYTATEAVDLSFPVSNEPITKVNVKAGDYVSEGDLLASLNVETLEDEIDEQKYRVDSLKLQLEQTRELYEFDLSSAEVLYQYTYKTDKDKENLADKKEAIEKQYQNTLEDLEDKIVVENKRLEEYRQKLRDGQLYAQMDGVIIFRASSLLGSYSEADKTVMTISSLDSYYFIVEGTDYMEYFVEGGNANVSCNGRIYETVVERKDEEAVSLYLKVLSDDMPGDGASGNIDLQLAQKENVLCIPKDALHESDKGPFVYLSKEGLLEMCYVSIGLEGEATVEITEGLKQGDTVVLKK